MTAAEFILCCKNAGLTADEIDEWNIGTIIDYIHMRVRSQSDKNVYSDDERYKILKQLEPDIEDKYRRGEITVEKYQRFKKQLGEWE